MTLGVVLAVPIGRRAITEDRNGDGRPDLWRRYSSRGELVEVDIDSNFDGRPDIRESYRRGALVRRDSDRNFNDRIDLVEEFDATSHEHIRSVVDVDDDGTADLLVLFHEGRPVFSKYEPSRAGSTQSARARPLTPLSDPFRAEVSMRGAGQTAAARGCAAVSASGGALPQSGAILVGSATSGCFGALEEPRAVPPFLFGESSRAPPTQANLLFPDI